MDAARCVTDAGEIRKGAKTSGTLFGQPIGTMIYDEAHHLRTFNKQAKSAKALASIAEFTMWLTATPIIAKPEVSPTSTTYHQLSCKITN